MSRLLLALGGLLILAAPAVADVQLSALLGSSSNLSADERYKIRRPVPGAMVGQPRRPRTQGDDVAGLPRYYGTPSQYEQAARAAARRHGIPEDLFLRLVLTESNWHPAAVSSKGAIGLAQLMPGTARVLGVNPHDPGQNLDGGARYLSQQYRRFGDWRLALAAYNAGPEAVERYSGMPPYQETRNYVRAILGQ